jgi:hypothetical protein
MREELSGNIKAQAYAGENEIAPHARATPSPSLIAHRSSWLFWLVQISRYGLAALFLFAVCAKLYMINDPKESFLKNMPYLVGERWAVPVAIAVIGAEVAAVALLISTRAARIGGMWAAALLAGFAGYALYYRYGLNNAEGLECGCFGGIIGSQLGVSTALRNLALLIPAALVIFGMPRLRRADQKTLETQEAPPPV